MFTCLGRKCKKTEGLHLQQMHRICNAHQRKTSLGHVIVSKNVLTLTLLTWRIWWAPTNASKWRMGFNSAFEGLNKGTESESLSINTWRKVSLMIKFHLGFLNEAECYLATSFPIHSSSQPPRVTCNCRGPTSFLTTRTSSVKLNTDWSSCCNTLRSSEFIAAWS